MLGTTQCSDSSSDQGFRSATNTLLPTQPAAFFYFFPLLPNLYRFEQRNNRFRIALDVIEIATVLGLVSAVDIPRGRSDMSSLRYGGRDPNEAR